MSRSSTAAFARMVRLEFAYTYYVLRITYYTSANRLDISPACYFVADKRVDRRLFLLLAHRQVMEKSRFVVSHF